MWRFLLPLAAGALVCLPASSNAAKLTSKGELRLETRVFSDDGDPDTVDAALGLMGRVEAKYRSKPFAAKARLFGRLDRQDVDRTLLVVEELWLETKKWDIELRVGADIVNWTATEAFHPADIVNARNLDSDVENYEKLGEPMVALSRRVGHGELRLLFMPYYSTPILTSPRSRLSFLPAGFTFGPVLRVEQSGAFTEDEFGAQGAVRFTQTIGDADIGLHIVHHMDRSQPEVVFDPELGLPRPVFRKVTQLGGTYQQVFDALVAKVELGYRVFADPDPSRFGPLPERDHLLAAVGFEYGVLHDSGVESTFILEGQSAFFADDEVRPFLGVFQRDAALGYRVALNDAHSSEALVTTIVDLEDPDRVFFNASFSRRVFETWTVSAAVRLVFGPSTADGLVIPAASDHVRLFVTRYF